MQNEAPILKFDHLRGAAGLYLSAAVTPLSSRVPSSSACSRWPIEAQRMDAQRTRKHRKCTFSQLSAHKCAAVGLSSPSRTIILIVNMADVENLKKAITSERELLQLMLKLEEGELNALFGVILSSRSSIIG